MFIGSSANVTNTAINPKMTDIGKDLAPVALINTAAVVLVVHPDVAAKSVKELVALAKSKPGELLYASTGVGFSRRICPATSSSTCAPASSWCTCHTRAAPRPRPTCSPTAST